MTFEELGIKNVKNGLFSTTCPSCSSTRKPEHRNTPCLTVNNVQGNRWYNCNHCNFKGNLDVMEKFSKVREFSRMPKEPIKVFSKEVTQLLNKKQIQPSTALKYGCYEAKNIKGSYELAFPYYRNYQLVNVMFRRTNPNKEAGEGKVYQLSKDKHGAESCYFGLQLLNLDSCKDITIVEGQFDALTHSQCGYENVLSVPMGAPSPNMTNLENKMAFAKDPYILELFSKAERIFLFTDGDENGLFLRDLLADIYGKQKCWIYEYPKGYKDSNEIYAGDIEKDLSPLGKVGIDKMYTLARPYPIKGIFEIKDVWREIENISEHGFNTGYSTGTPHLDDLFRLREKILCGMTGVPGCFYGGQLVYTKHGIKPISEIKAGDIVLSYNHELQMNEFQWVVKTHEFKHTDEKLYKITLKDGTVIKVTENHKFYDGTKYLEIKHWLMSGIEVIHNGNCFVLDPKDIKSYEEIEVETVYDLTISDNSNFYLKTNSLPILVHNSGKSLFWRQYSHDLVKNNKDMHLAGFTPEMRPVSREYAKIMELFTGKSLTKGRTNSMNDTEKAAAYDFVMRHYTLVNPDVHNWENLTGKIDAKAANNPKGLRSILAYMKYLKHIKGIKGFWIDAWNKLDHQRPSSKPAEEFISQELDFLLEFLDRENLFCVVIAHPTKMETIRGGNYRKPTLYDIKGSSAWNEKLDIGVITHRNKYYKTGRKDENDEEIWEISDKAPTQVTVEKMKFDELGCEGSIDMYLDKSKGGKFSIHNPDNPHNYQNKLGKNRTVTITTSIQESGKEEFDDLPF